MTLVHSQELSLDIRNHTQLINEIADQRRYSAISASNITTGAEVKGNWERLNRDLAQRSKDLEYILRTQKPEVSLKLTLPTVHIDLCHFDNLFVIKYEMLTIVNITHI